MVCLTFELFRLGKEAGGCTTYFQVFQQMGEAVKLKPHLWQHVHCYIINVGKHKSCVHATKVVMIPVVKSGLFFTAYVRSG